MKGIVFVEQETMIAIIAIIAVFFAKTTDSTTLVFTTPKKGWGED